MQGRRSALRWALYAAIALPAVAQVAAMCWAIAARFGCPLDVEYLEGPHIYHAWRMANGLPLYADPAGGFATFPYPPLFWVAIWGAAHVWGFCDQAGRAVSILSLAGTVFIMARVVVAEAPRRAMGIAMAALAIAGMCAGYAYCGGAYDLARPDTMSMFLAIAAAAALGADARSLGRILLSGALVTASIYTKQTSVIFAAWLVAFALWRNRRGGVIFAAVTGLSCLAILVALEVRTHGWFVRWISYPGHHPLYLDRTFDAVWLLVKHAPFLPLLPALAVWLRRRGALRPATVLWTGMLATGVLASVLAGIKALGWLNVWMPGTLLSWPVAMLLFADGLRAIGREREGERGWQVLAASGLMLVLNLYRVGPFIPQADRWTAARRLDEIVRPLGGDVVVTTAPMVAVRAGSTVSQPILATFEDAQDGDMPVDYVDALVTSGVRWVVTTDRCTSGKYVGARSIEARMARAFVRVKTYDFDLHTMSSWDKPTNVSLWQRADAMAGGAAGR